MKLGYGHLAHSDLDEILSGVGQDWNKFTGSHLVVLGGTGFVGSWLVSALLHANKSLDLDLRLTVPTRNVNAAYVKLRLDGEDPIDLVEADIREFSPSVFGRADYYLHAATPSVKSTGAANQSLVTEATLGGASRLLTYISEGNSLPSFLHTSSGIVYGSQPLDLEKLQELEVVTEPEISKSYAHAKWEAENLVRSATENGKIRGSNPRLFAFFGPHLALDEHFAIGNFMSDAMSGKKIQVQGNPNTVRSYLYPTDLTIWLIKLLAEPNIGAMNFGSEHPVTMMELAQTITTLTSGQGIDFLNPAIDASRYVPSTRNTQEVLNVTQRVSLTDGLERWIKWLEASKK